MTVRASLGQLFVRNWPIKLAALFFAIMLYVAVAAQQPLSQSFALRLAIGIPPGRTVRQQPAGVTVVIAGTGSEILKLRSFPRVIRKVIPDTFSTSLWRIQLQAADVELPKGIGVQVVDIRPRDVEILLDSVSHKDVRIVPRVKVGAEPHQARLGDDAANRDFQRERSLLPDRPHRHRPPGRRPDLTQDGAHGGRSDGDHRALDRRRPDNDGGLGLHRLSVVPRAGVGDGARPGVAGEHAHPGQCARRGAPRREGRARRLRPAHRERAPRPRGARRTRLRVPQAEDRAWLTSFWESRRPATKRPPPSSWVSADAPSSPASSSSRRTCTRCSVAWCRSSPAGRTCPPCRRWWTARSPKRDSPGAPWTRWR